MHVRFAKSAWEMSGASLDAFARRARSDGFEIAEVFLAGRAKGADEVRDAIGGNGLELFAQVICEGRTPDEHRASLDRQFEFAKRCGATAVNAHTGSDFFGFDENVSLFEHAAALSEATGLPVFHETHRGRALYNLPDAVRYVEALPGLRLTADYSHFMCVHESDLAGREALLDRLAPRVDHIHARVGFAEGPQVAHPLAPEWRPLLDRYVGIWRSLASAMAARGATPTVTPEAGPPPYMPVLPFSGAPVADAWAVNVAMRDHLRPLLAV